MGRGWGWEGGGAKIVAHCRSGCGIPLPGEGVLVPINWNGDIKRDIDK